MSKTIKPPEKFAFKTPLGEMMLPSITLARTTKEYRKAAKRVKAVLKGYVPPNGKVFHVQEALQVTWKHHKQTLRACDAKELEVAISDSFIQNLAMADIVYKKSECPTVYTDQGESFNIFTNDGQDCLSHMVNDMFEILAVPRA